MRYQLKPNLLFISNYDGCFVSQLAQEEIAFACLRRADSLHFKPIKPPVDQEFKDFSI